MIAIDENGYINLINWEKHQNIDGLERNSERTRNRVAKHCKLKALLDGNVTCNINVTISNATYIYKDIYMEIIQYLN